MDKATLISGIFLGTITIQGFALGLINLIGGVLSSYFFFGLLMEIVPPVLILIMSTRLLKEEGKRKMLILAYSIGILFGVLLVNFDILHTPHFSPTP